VAILLTVEGSTTLILWNIIKNYSNSLTANLPCPACYGDIGAFDQTMGLLNSEKLIDYLNETIIQFNENFKNSEISTLYNYTADLVALKNIPAPYNSTEWNDDAYLIETKIFFGVYDFLYAQFKIEAPGSATVEAGGSVEDQTLSKINEASGLFNIFNTVFYYFFISAGAMLIVLAVMYWFGKNHKSRGEYASIVMRTVAGLALMVGLYAGTNTVLAGDFDLSSWIIPTVVLSYFVVIVMDSLLVWHSNKTIGRQTSTNRHEVYSKVDGSVQKRNGSGSSADNSV
jgi:hypothetical protein